MIVIYFSLVVVVVVVVPQNQYLSLTKKGELSWEWSLDFFKVSREKFFAKANFRFLLENNLSSTLLLFCWEYNTYFLLRNVQNITNPRIWFYILRTHMLKCIITGVSAYEYYKTCLRNHWDNSMTPLSQ